MEMNNPPKLPERLPPPLMMDLERKLTAASTANLAAMEAGLNAYVQSDRCPVALRNILKSYKLKVVPKIIAYLLEAKK
jgi:hypothetical protein